MQIAVDLLRKGESFGRICDTIGYQSEAAFQRSFKQVVGASPGKFRKK
jgi:AraC family transcriptional activator of mtrCDE